MSRNIMEIQVSFRQPYHSSRNSPVLYIKRENGSTRKVSAVFPITHSFPRCPARTRALARAASASAVSRSSVSCSRICCARWRALRARATSIFCGHSTASARMVTFSGVISTKPESSAAVFCPFSSVMVRRPGAMILGHGNMFRIRLPPRRPPYYTRPS